MLPMPMAWGLGNRRRAAFTAKYGACSLRNAVSELARARARHTPLIPEGADKQVFFRSLETGKRRCALTGKSPRSRVRTVSHHTTFPHLPQCVRCHCEMRDSPPLDR